jgi:succinyl-CoA synthetase alpha subunit
MSFVVNDVRTGTYLDSVALMRIAAAVKAGDGVEDCGLMMATPANKRIMADAGVLAKNGEAASPADLVIALRARDASAADAALAIARAALDKPSAAGAASRWAPRSLAAASDVTPGATLAIISVPGAFAAVEASKAIARGLNVLMFSDNVPLADEVALKRAARDAGVLMMGPDCGTAILGGVPLAFANVVPRGDIGIVGASGTGIQEVSCLIGQLGAGISQAIGTGGRDLKAEVGGITTLMAIDLLDHDPATRHIVLVSKPPAAEVERIVLDRIARSSKPATICFLGGGSTYMPQNARIAGTLTAAAELATGRSLHSSDDPWQRPRERRPGKAIRGLFAGGTLCAEAQIVLLAEAPLEIMSNTPVPGARSRDAKTAGHLLLDLGAYEYTLGRPHPMIEPSVRDAPLIAALSDPHVGVVLLDCVLGYGGHRDPAGHLAAVLERRPRGGPLIVASVTGTDADPQSRAAQVARLEAAGVVVQRSNANAAAFAAVAIEG